MRQGFELVRPSKRRPQQFQPVERLRAFDDRSRVVRIGGSLDYLRGIEDRTEKNRRASQPVLRRPRPQKKGRVKRAYLVRREVGQDEHAANCVGPSAPSSRASSFCCFL